MISYQSKVSNSEAELECEGVLAEPHKSNNLGRPTSVNPQYLRE